jgi:hypothetical protein
MSSSNNLPEGVRDFPPRPVVFTLRPESYDVIAPEEVRQWEEVMGRHAGLDPTKARPGESGSWSVTGGEFGWDDCDLVANDGPVQYAAKEEPAVFKFKPTHYAPVPGDELEKWDRLMQERVGLSAEAAQGSRMAGTPTYGWCGGDGDFDYCDCI